MSDHHLDPVRRLRVLAGALPGCAYVERVLDVPFDAAWAVGGDLVAGVPRFESTVSRVEVERHDGDRLVLTTHGLVGPRRTFEAILRPGWCWMQSGPILVGMAATPTGDGRTLFAHLEGTRFGATRVLRPLLRRKMRGELDRIEQLASMLPPGPPDRPQS